MSTTTGTATVVPLTEIHVEDGANPRTRFDEAALRELADSITKHGLIQPLVVHPNGDAYTLIAGERRYRAAALAGLTSVPVTIRAEAESALELAVDENLHRQALDPIEEAHAFQAILQSGKLTKKQLAERVSKPARHVNERLRLLGLPDATARLHQTTRLQPRHQLHPTQKPRRSKRTHPPTQRTHPLPHIRDPRRPRRHKRPPQRARTQLIRP